MIRYSVDGNLFTVEGPGVEPIEAAMSVFDPAEAVRQFLGAIDGNELDRIMLDRLGPGSPNPAVLVLEILKEMAGGA